MQTHACIVVSRDGKEPRKEHAAACSAQRLSVPFEGHIQDLIFNEEVKKKNQKRPRALKRAGTVL
jgi:hypothetical protein